MKKQLLTTAALCTILKLTSVAQCGNFPAIVSTGSNISCGPLSATLSVPSDEAIQSTAFNVPATGTFAGGRTEPFAFSIGCKGYVGAGAGYNSSLNLDKTLNDFWEFDPVTETWSQKANFPVARRGAIGFSIGNYGYAGGGANSSGNYQTGFYRYDPTTNTWLNRANIPVARWLASGASDGTFGYMLGGYEDQNLDANDGFYQYDPTANTWTPKANFGGGVRAEATMMAINGTIYAGMGYATSFDINNNPSSSFIKDDFWAYDSGANTWSQKVNCPTKSKGAIAFGIGNKGYVYGGYGLNTLDFREYNPTNNTWTQRTNLLASIYKGASFVIGNVAYFGLGVATASDDAYSAKSDWRKYYPHNTSIAWSTGATTNTIAISASVSTVYTATATSITGLSGTSNAYSVTVSNGPTIAVSGTTICPNTNYTLTPTGATNYSFSPAGPAISPSVTTTYTVSGTDALGCVGSKTVTIYVTPLSAPTLGNLSVCNGATIADLTATGLSGSTINWYATSTGGTALTGTTALVSGTTYYASQALNGCESATRAAATPTILAITPAPYRYKVTLSLNNTNPFGPPAGCWNSNGVHLEDGFENGKRRFVLTGVDFFGGNIPFTSYVKYNGTNWIITYNSATSFSTNAAGVNNLPPTTGWVSAGCGFATFNSLILDSLKTNYCAGSVLQQVTGIGASIKWYDAATGGSLLPSTTVLVNNTHYYASQTINGCESPTRLDFVPQLINSTFSITSTLGASVCGPITASNFTLSAIGTGTISWFQNADINSYDIAFGITPDGTGNTHVLTGVTSTTTKYVSAYDGTCYSYPRVPATVSVNITPVVGLSSVDITVTGNCPNPTATYVFENIFNGKNRYKYVQGPVTFYLQFDGTKWVWEGNGTPVAENTNVIAGVLPPTTGWIVLNPTCSTSTVVLSNFVNQTVPSTFCTGATLADVIIAGTQNLKWYDAATGGTLLPSTTAMVAGTHYYVTQTVNGCESTTRYDLVPTINALPTISATSSNTIVCVGQTASLTASGASTYTWSNSASGTVIAVSPTTTTVYTVTGSDANGCQNTALVTQNVSVCTSIDNLALNASASLVVYPNPNNGVFTFEVNSNTTMELVDVLGKTILKQQLEAGKYNLNITEYANGVYFIKAISNNNLKTIKVVKQ